MILWTVALQAPLSVGFSRQEYWSGLLCPPSGDLPNPGIEPRSPTRQVDSLPSEPPEKPPTAHQFSSVTQLCPTLCSPMDCSMPGFPVHHQLLELTQAHAHRVGDIIQPPHPLSFLFSSHLQSFPASESFPMSQFFTSGGQRIGVSASESIFPMNTQD